MLVAARAASVTMGDASSYYEALQQTMRPEAQEQAEELR
jgi:hypothetical protein